jgi:hypothetical protein
MRQAAQLVVNQRQKFIHRVAIANAPVIQLARNFAGRTFHFSA